MFRQLSLLNAKPLKKTEKSWLSGVPLPVEILRKSRQRSIRLIVKPNGIVRITASKSTSLQDLRAFTLSHLDWIETSLRSYEALRSRYPRKQYVEGETFLFQGAPVTLHLRPEITRKAEVSKSDSRLICRIPLLLWENETPHHQRSTVAQAVRQFYSIQGEAYLKQSVLKHAEQMKLYPKDLSFRSQKTRWGSCSAQGHISLNWRLIVAPPEAADYVVIHELAHLQHPNHSQRFWSLVAQHCPDYRTHRLWLKRHQYEVDFLAQKSEIHPGD